MSDFEHYLEMLSLRAGLPRDSIKRKLRRYQEGRAEHSGSDEDWDTDGFDLLREARKELDDLWLYLSKYLHNRVGDYISKDFAIAMKLMAMVEVLLNGQISAQSTKPECDPTDDAQSAHPADGQLVSNEMACIGWWEDEEARLYGL